MEPADLRTLIVRSFGISILFSILFGFWSLPVSMGFGFAAVWSTLNLWAIQALFSELLTRRRPFWLLIWAHCKLPVLYGIGALVILTVPLSMGAVIAGFHVPFVVIVAEAIRRSWTDDSSVSDESTSQMDR